jgi:hypothetical protein
MMIDSLSRLNTHADPGMGRVSVTVVRREIGESPYEGMGRADMTNADWWARVVQARTERDNLRSQRVWALRNGEHEAAIDLKAVPGIGADIVLTVGGELRKTRLFRSHEQAELVGAIADTRAMFEAKGWA